MDLDETVRFPVDSLEIADVREFSIQPVDNRGKKKGTPFFLKGFQITIGRERSSDVVIADEGVSRLHAVLSHNDHDWNIADAQSKNGVWVNELRLLPFVPLQLRHGDIISLGDPKESKLFYLFTTQDKASICSPDDNTDPKQEIFEDALLILPSSSLLPSDKGKRSVEQTVSKIKEELLLLKEKDKIAQELKETSTTSQDLAEQLLQTKELLEVELNCSICSEPFIQACTLGCSHTFCKLCIYQWKKLKNECPICRTKIKTITRGLVLDNVVEQLIDNLSPSSKQHRAKVYEKRGLPTFNLGIQAQNSNVGSAAYGSTSQRPNVQVRPKHTAQPNALHRTTTHSVVPIVRPQI